MHKIAAKLWGGKENNKPPIVTVIMYSSKIIQNTVFHPAISSPPHAMSQCINVPGNLSEYPFSLDHKFSIAAYKAETKSTISSLPRNKYKYTNKRIENWCLVHRSSIFRHMYHSFSIVMYFNISLLRYWRIQVLI